MNFFRDTHFEYEVSVTAVGTRVRVTHLPSGKTRAVDPITGESTGGARLRLRKEIENELLKPGDFTTRLRRTKQGTVVTVTHRPSGKSQRVEVVERDHVSQVIGELTDDIFYELTGEHRSKTE